MNEVKISRQEIISLCRLCLAKDLASIDIFEDGNELRHLYTKIVACLPVQVFANDTLPHKICEVCNAKVDDFYQFWTSTAKNQKQLNDWLQVATDQKVDHASVAVPRIKVEAEERDDYEDYDDGARADDSDDDEEEASAPKRIKTTHSDTEEDTKPTDLVSSMPDSSDVNGKKKSKEHKLLTDDVDDNSSFHEIEDRKFKCHLCCQCYKTRKCIKRHMQRIHLNHSKPFECTICRYRFARSRDLQTHTSNLHVKKELGHFPNILNCPHCMKSISTRSYLSRHIIRMHPHIEVLKKTPVPVDTGDSCTLEEWNQLVKTKSRTCPVCQNNFATPIGMRRHLREVHTTQKKFICELCGKRFHNSKCVKQHKRFTHSTDKKNIERKYECDFCSRKFPSKKILSEHINVHTGNKPYECHLCGSSFSRRFTYQNHMKKHLHREGKLKPEQLHECSICKKTFLQPNRLKQHMDFTHGDAWKECKICGVKRKGSLARHMLSHTGEKKVCCHICGKSLRGKLDEHMLTHTGERPHTCEICGARFKNKWYMSVHMRKHTGDKPFECKYCNKSYVLQSALKLHLQKHKTEESQSQRDTKKNKCQICKMGFENEEDLNSHYSEHFSLT